MKLTKMLADRKRTLQSGIDELKRLKDQLKVQVDGVSLEIASQQAELSALNAEVAQLSATFKAEVDAS